MNEDASINGRSKDSETNDKKSRMPSKKTSPTSKAKSSKEDNASVKKTKNTTKVFGSQADKISLNKSLGTDRSHIERIIESGKSGHVSDKERYTVTDDDEDDNDEVEVDESYIKFTPRRTRKRRTQRTNLADSIEKLLESQQDSDIDIIVDGHPYAAHKAILNVRCPVIMQMFNCDSEEVDVEEVERDCIYLDNIDKHVFKEFLRFLYSGKTGNIDDKASELLEVADRFNVDDLKDVCSKHIISNLSPEKAIEVLMISVNYKAKKLRKQTIKYMERNLDEVIDSNWDRFRSKSTIRSLLSALLPQ